MHTLLEKMMERFIVVLFMLSLIIVSIILWYNLLQAINSRACLCNDNKTARTYAMKCPFVDQDPVFYSQGTQDVAIWHKYFGGPQTPFCYGTFVEAGAYDGIYYSNSLFFEQYLGWTGICVEPNPEVFYNLSINRPRCRNVHAALGSVSGTATIHIDRQYPVLSKIGSSNISVPLWRLDDLLLSMDTTHVNYLSLDVEDNEYDVLLGIDFSKIMIDVISLEMHLWNKHRDQVHRLLVNNGFKYDMVHGDEIWLNDLFTG